MKNIRIFFTPLLVICLFMLNSCQKDNSTTVASDAVTTETTTYDEATNNANQLPTAFAATENDHNDDDDMGAVFVMDNAASGNKVIIYSRAENGFLTKIGSVATDGLGTGGGLGSQGALVRKGNLLYACNAGSNEITVFKVRGLNLTKLEKVSSHGMRPISVTVSDNWVYILNGGGNGSIDGFKWNYSGHLTYIANSTRPLSTNAAGPAQIEFNPWGTHLIVTEKATNMIDVYPVDRNGLAGMRHSFPSVGMTPFGFEFDKRGRLIVSDAFGGAAGQSALTSYNLGNTGNLSLITGPVATTQTAACWVVVTDNGRYTYTSNTGSASISGYKIGNNGALSLLKPNGVSGMTGAGPIDMSLSNGSKFLYSLNGGAHSLSIFKVSANGDLTSLGDVSGIPVGAVGLSAK